MGVIKKTIEISRQPVYLSSRNEQLIVQPIDEPKDAARSIPCEDIGLLLIDEPRCSMTQGALETVLRHGGAVVVCGRNHLPTGLLLPVSSHTQQVERLGRQINATQPRIKRLWQQIVAAKVRAQSANTPKAHPARRKLDALAKDVKSGDTTNVEAQAAKAYWAYWRESHTGFYRDTDGQDPINSHLNYGYAVLRAAVARALVSAGLHPALGLHHCNRANAFCLADDLMEPLRPAVDAIVFETLATNPKPIDQTSKAKLLQLLSTPFEANEQRGPLMVQLHRYASSLAGAYANKGSTLSIPSPLTPTE